MVGDDTDAIPVEPGSITLPELYKSTQEKLVSLIERSLDLDKKDLAGHLDDVLLRQRFWEDDIHLGDGALQDLEANDAGASVIIRRYIDEIGLLLHDINGSLSPSFEENNYEDKVSLLLKTNTRLCDHVEIFDAIAANGNPDAVGNNQKATAISQLRRQLEKESKMLAEKEKTSSAPSTHEESISKRRQKNTAWSALSPSGESETSTAKFPIKESSGKRKADPSSSAELGSADLGPNSQSPVTEKKTFGLATSNFSYWICSECDNMNTEALCPQKCGNCGHMR